MPGRLEFETEFANEAEEAVQHMQFDPGDGINPRTGELDPETELKMVVMDSYNSRLTTRANRKRVIFEHNLLDYRKNAAQDKKRTKEERDLFNKAKPFARMMNHDDFTSFTESLEYEHNLRQAIAQLQDWRQMRIGDLKTGEKYEADKQTRAQRPAPTGSFDRLAGVRPPKPALPIETPSATTELTASEFPSRLKPPTPPTTTTSLTTKSEPKETKLPLTNGSLNPHNPPPPASQIDKKPQQRYTIPPLNGTPPLKLTNENATDLHLLTREEQELCSVLRILPKPYLVMKESLIREAMKTGGGLKRKLAKEVCKVCLCFGGRGNEACVLTLSVGRLTRERARGFLISSYMRGGFRRRRGIWLMSV